MSIYLVTSRTAFRGHRCGTTFEAYLREPEERRAVARGAIEVLERSDPSVKPGSYKLPKPRRMPQKVEGSDDLAYTDPGRGRDRARG